MAFIPITKELIKEKIADIKAKSASDPKTADHLEDILWAHTLRTIAREGHPLARACMRSLKIDFDRRVDEAGIPS